ncbi:MAG: AmmeMemoRadiSam system protein A [Acidimicrobiales bacterium]
MSDVLLEVARNAVYAAVRSEQYRPSLDELPAEVRVHGNCFVTLTKSGALRGCIGSLEARNPLAVDVAINADKATRDPRFPLLAASELGHLELEISVLGDPHPFEVSSYDNLVESLSPGGDGVVVRSDEKRAVFLPAVWGDLREPDVFIAALWRKAGLAERAWPSHVRLERFRTRSIGPRGISGI